MEYDPCKPVRFLTWFDGAGGSVASKNDTDKDKLIEPSIKSVLPKWVEIPAPIFSKRDRSNGTSELIAGNETEGTIGTSKVKVKFEGSGESGQVSIIGEVNEQGKWRQLGQFMQIETTNAHFEGVANNSAASGTLTVKKNGGSMEWQVTFAAAKDAEIKERENTSAEFVGKWKKKVDWENHIVRMVLTLKDGGTGELLQHDIAKNGRAFIDDDRTSFARWTVENGTATITLLPQRTKYGMTKESSFGGTTKEFAEQHWTRCEE